MSSTEDPKGPSAPSSESAPAHGDGVPTQGEAAPGLPADAGTPSDSGVKTPSESVPAPGAEPEPGAAGVESPPAATASEPQVSYAQTTDSSYGYSEDPYSYGESTALTTTSKPPEPPPPPPPPPSAPEEPEDQEEEGMLRMSFLEHLEELRTRILRTLAGIGVAYVACLFFADQLWTAVETPALAALTSLGIKNPRLIQTTPMETFNILWLKLPILAAVFVASPWALFQVWSFIAPGLYKKERRWAAPFIISSAGLFILGGVFAYFVAFRYGLAFLLGIGVGKGIEPLITVSEYFDLFINVMLGVGIVFELPVLIFFLTLIRVATPSFLIRNSRYAILIIVIVAAIVTPTPDVFNLMLFSVPMVLLFYVGIFASYLLVLSREGKRFPWGKVLPWVGLVAAVVGVLLYFAITRYGYHWVNSWPYLTR